MGEVLIAGTASLLICVFLSPKFIEFLREREFGQHIREEGPQEHHAKAGTPTMGGIIIFTAIAVPFLLLTDRDARSVGVFGVALACALLGFADDYTKIVKRRSLGLRGRTKLVVTVADLGRPLARGDASGPTCPTRVNLRVIDAQIDLGYLYPVFIYLVLAGTTSAVNLTDGLDGLAAGCAAIVAARLHRDHVHDAPDRPRARRRLPRRRRASASCGSTRSPRRSSWATRARSASAARSRRWR